MNIKPIKNIEEYIKYVTPEERVFFFDSSDSSPVSEISSFPKRIFTGIHGSRIASGYRGSVYVGRDDTTDTVALNIDTHPFNISCEGKGELTSIIKNTEYHHTDEIPYSWKAPRSLINRVEELRSFRRLSSISKTHENSLEDSSS